MPDADVIYSDVKFTTGRGSRSAETTSSSAQETYSEVKIPQSDPTTSPELTDSQHPAAVKKRRGTLRTLERVALLVLSLLLAAAVAALFVTHHENIQTKSELEKLRSNFTTVLNNRTEDTACPTCDKGWEHHGGKCYYFSSTRLSWSKSRAECSKLGGDLVVINHKEEQKFLVSRLMTKMTDDEDKFWIGLSDSEIEGRWLWVDRSPLNISLTFWLSDPDNWLEEDPLGEDCVRMGERNGAQDLKCWHDKSCKQLQKSICEKHELYTISR